MPLLQGQPFKLITSLKNVNPEITVFTIEHTGERFYSKKDYEDRLALYSQNIWTCQCTGKGCLTHQEAWLSECAVKASAKAAVSAPLHKPLLMLVHHSLSPLDQLVDAASILCYSQFHVGEEVTMSPEAIPVRVIKVKDAPRCMQQQANRSHGNGVVEWSQNAIVNGTSNGILNPTGDVDPAKESLPAFQAREETCHRRDMLPRLYSVLCHGDKSVIDDIAPTKLTRVSKVPSKDQMRMFIRSCALRHRGSTCTPWMVSEELLQEHGISSKLPSLFLGAKPTVTSPQKRKKIPPTESSKKFKPDPPNVEKVAPPVTKSLPNTNGGKPMGRMFGQKNPNLTVNQSSIPGHRPMSGLTHSGNSGSGSLMPQSKLNPLPSQKVPKKRGRPRLSAEEKERNKKLRQATLFNATGSMTGSPKFLKILSKSTADASPVQTLSIPPQLPPGISAAYKSPLKRATTPESLMKLPLMRRLVHEYKTIKGVMGQYRRMAYTMDLVLSKLTPHQIELIPDEVLRNDLYLRQQKVENKKLLSSMTPEERKDYMKKKAREVALERWKERKLKNLKIEDKTLSDLKTLPVPKLVATPEGVDNSLFGDVVMITEFVKCYKELLLGEEKFKITSWILMEALNSNEKGYRVIVDIICCVLPAIIHDDTSKHCKDLGLSISAIPINYQTASELARLCLKKQQVDDHLHTESEEFEQISKEETELSDALLAKLVTEELWSLSPPEVIAVLKALVHKALGCSSLNAYMEETDEKLSIAFREKRKVLKKLTKERLEETQKKRADKKPKGDTPKRQRGRPKGYSPKIGGNIQDFYDSLKKKEEEAERPMVDTVLQRRKSVEAVKKEKEALEQLEKERQKQQEDDGKKRAVERKYEDLLEKRDNLLRRQPIGYDRDHNRYWIFHTTTPGLYMERGWIGSDTNTQFIQEGATTGKWTTIVPDDLNPHPMEMDKIIPKTEEDINLSKESICGEGGIAADAANGSGLLYENGCGAPKGGDIKCEDNSAESDEERPLSIVTGEVFDGEDEKPLADVKTKIGHGEDDTKPLSSVKSKLTLSPMKMSNRGRPPREAYVLVDEDTQTFPNVEPNSWHCYGSMDDVKILVEALSDKGQRESQLLASININRDRLQYHYNLKPEALKLTQDDIIANLVKTSLKEDIVQIERELIEGWLGGIPLFDEWEVKVKQCETVNLLSTLLIEAQKCMQLKFLKGLMAPLKKQITPDDPEITPEYEDVEGAGVARWREAVLSCTTYSRMHVLVGMFDSSIKWERSMATRKCKVCRSKQKDDPLLMCEKCENSYHAYCLRPPLKGQIPDSWLCPTCMPKIVRRDKEEAEVETNEDPDEKEDPTFSVTRNERVCKKKPTRPAAPRSDAAEKKVEHECCICWGRVGLIFCSKCTTPYHSECHEPPLQSRARKDWVCAACLSSKDGINSKARPERLESPTMRRNVFGDMEQIVPKEKRGSNQCERNRLGKFVKKSLETVDLTTEMESSEELLPALAEDEEQLGGGRNRGARMTALAKAKDSDSRRSGRNQETKSYLYESAEESSGSENDEDEPEISQMIDQENRPLSTTIVSDDGSSGDSDNDEREIQSLNSTLDHDEHVPLEVGDDLEGDSEENRSSDEGSVRSDDNLSDTLQDEYSDDQMEISQEMSEDES